MLCRPVSEDKSCGNSLPSVEKSPINHNVINLKAEGIIAGGMIPKVDCITHALKGNMSKAVIIDGRIPHSILIEILSKDGSGTLFTR